jgi:MFS superfamily sulfate permease-like transporter
MESINTIDSSAIEIFSDLIQYFSKENIILLLTEENGSVRDKLHKSGLTNKIGEHNFFVTNEDAFNHISGVKREYLSGIALEMNATNDK